MQSQIWNVSATTTQGFSRNGTVDAGQLSPFGDGVNEAIKAHALLEYPKECCGIVVDGSYIPCENVHADPFGNFEISKSVLRTFANRIQGVAHSHPDFMPWPSYTDMASQMDWDVPFAIVSLLKGSENPIVGDLFWFGDTLPQLPLLGRTFRPGVQDCFALARHYYNETYGILPPDFPRDNAWWETVAKEGRPDMFIEHLDASGFEIISSSMVSIGDGFAVAYGGVVVNHCGVFSSEKEILHHLSGHPSTTNSAQKWFRRAQEGGRFFRLKR